MSQMPPSPEQPWQPDIQPHAPAEGGGKAVASLVLGIISMLAWFCPIIGLPISITGLILGLTSLKSDKRGMAIAGIVLNSIGLLLTLVNAGIGAYMGATGQHPLVNGPAASP